MLLMQRRKRPDGAPSFPKKLLEKDPAELAESGRAEEITAHLSANPGEADQDTQAKLASRFYSDAHWRSNARLILPILVSAAVIAAANEALKMADRLYPTLAFACAIFASALFGRHRSISFERSLSQKIPDIFSAGGAASESAQENYACVVAEGQDAATAHRLLSSGLVASMRAQVMLAETILRHGTEEQASSLLGTGGICGLAESALRIKSGKPEEGL